MDTPPFINDPTVYNVTDDVTIRCRSNAIPSPTATTWQRDDVIISSNALLSIPSINQSDDGVYTCCTSRVVAGETVRTCSNITLTVQCEC